MVNRGSLTGYTGTPIYTPTRCRLCTQANTHTQTAGRGRTGHTLASAIQTTAKGRKRYFFRTACYEAARPHGCTGVH